MLVIKAKTPNEAWRKTFKLLMEEGTAQDNNLYYRDELTLIEIEKPSLFKVKKDYTVNVIIDGLNDVEKGVVRSELKKLGINYKNIRGMKDEQNPLLRLADSMAGFLRDYEIGQVYTKELFNKFSSLKIIHRV